MSDHFGTLRIKGLKLCSSKATQKITFLSLLISNIFPGFITVNLNDSMSTSLLPDSLKLVDIKPIFKKVLRNGKGNYRPVSMRLNISKLYKTFSISRLTLRFYLLFSVSD